MCYFSILWRLIYETDLCQWSWQQGINLVLIPIQQLVRSVRQGCAAVNNANGRHAIYWLCDFRTLGTGGCGVVVAIKLMCIEWISFWRIALLNNHIYWSKIIERKKLQSFGEHSHKCEADVSILGQYTKKTTKVTLNKPKICYRQKKNQIKQTINRIKITNEFP